MARDICMPVTFLLSMTWQASNLDPSSLDCLQHSMLERRLYYALSHTHNGIPLWPWAMRASWKESVITPKNLGARGALKRFHPKDIADITFASPKQWDSMHTHWNIISINDSPNESPIFHEAAMITGINDSFIKVSLSLCSRPHSVPQEMTLNLPLMLRLAPSLVQTVFTLE